MHGCKQHARFAAAFVRARKVTRNQALRASASACAPGPVSTRWSAIVERRGEPLLSPGAPQQNPTAANTQKIPCFSGNISAC